MTRWTIEADRSPHGITYDVMGKGGRPTRRRKQDLDSLPQAMAFVLRYGQPGDRVRVRGLDGYAHTVDPWGEHRRTLASTLNRIDSEN